MPTKLAFTANNKGGYTSAPSKEEKIVEKYIIFIFLLKVIIKIKMVQCLKHLVKGILSFSFQITLKNHDIQFF